MTDIEVEFEPKNIIYVEKEFFLELYKIKDMKKREEIIKNIINSAGNNVQQD